MVEFKDEFEKNRNVEREALATVNFFRLLMEVNIAECTKFPREAFLIMGGDKIAQRLQNDCLEGNIDIFTKSVNDLFKKLEQDINYLQSIKFSKSTLTYELLNDYELFKSFESWTKLNQEAYLELACQRAIPEEMVLMIYECKPRERN